MKYNKFIREDVSDFDWIQQQFDETPDEPHFVALADCYGVGMIKNLEEVTWTHYGLTIYRNEDDEEYVVGDKDEAMPGLREYYQNLIDDIGIEGWNPNIIDVDDYFWMSDTDCRLWAGDLSDSDVENMDDKDLLRATNLEDEYDTIEDRIYEIENTEIPELQERMEREGEDGEYLENDIDALESLVSDLRDDQEKLIDEAREQYRSSGYEEHYNNFKKDPAGYLVELGYYGNKQDVYKNNTVQFDENGFITELLTHEYFGEMNGYDGEYCEANVADVDYICMRIN